MRAYFLMLLFLGNCFNVFCFENDIAVVFDPNYIKPSTLAYWSNATVPFYIMPEHFDSEQTLTIMKTLSMFAFKTCLKFLPVMVPPSNNQHVMTFINPDGIRRCVMNTDGHSIDEPHYVTLGYDCMTSPKIEMMVMQALGFPYEHTRVTRDLFIEVLPINIEPAYIELFTKGNALPPELRNLPYDYNSVMHFGERDYSKNGHRTILIKDHKVVQNRDTLTQTDLKKIEIVYGPECQTRDRQEKIDLCQGYPGVARKKRESDNQEIGEREKREIKLPRPGLEKFGNHEDLKEELINLLRKKRNVIMEHETNDIRAKRNQPIDNVRRKRSLVNEPSQRKSLRVNPNITPPPEMLNDLTDSLKELGIDDEIDELTDKVYKVTSKALMNARDKFCNNTERPSVEVKRNLENDSVDLKTIVETVAEYARTVVYNAMSNMTAFCESPDVIESYQRQRCSFNDGSSRCRPNYRSTKSGAVRHSTNYRPAHVQPTRHEGRGYKQQFDKMFRAGNETDNTEVTTEMIKTTAVNEKIESGERDNSTKETQVRRKRDVKQVEAEEAEEAEEENGMSVPKEENTTKWGKMKMSTKAKRTDKEKDFFKKRSKISDTSSAENWESSKISLEHETKVKETSEAEVVKDEIVEELKESESEQELVDDVKSSPERPEKKISKGHYTEKKSRIKLPKTVQLSKANDEFYSERKWPRGIVRFMIKPEPTFDLDDLRARLGEVNRILQKKTCTKLKEITEDSAGKYEDYLVVDASQDYVTGKVGGKQHFGSIELFQGNQHRQHTAMMVMAMLGFYFEVSRHDRDKYVRVHSRHIRADKLHHFEKIRDDATLSFPYDYKSATHPAWQFWRKIGKTGISTVATYKEQDPDGSIMKSLGQNEQLLSEIDIVKINSVYGVECFRKKHVEKVEKKNKETPIENEEQLHSGSSEE